ncbi:hypothetical protein GPECTOR_4g990 [Gonium pectorale]|uniref:Lon N-terminal domain-containing protein n=1 Tax=Gonium pectorale TaxID=33097 RepID=A0A150GZ15_GONPE|nr:hypothetical protein GPECTOR_4g990 [Gonium pectorale]|eukprot:KXZ54918.1 hypothetical protein GPECTOR_4g990 [Gonium pectorale]
MEPGSGEISATHGPGVLRCKVLRLHDSSSYLLLLEELLSSPHQMLVHSAVQPAGQQPGQGGRLGAFEAGGFEFFLSTIVKVIDVKQTERGVLLRVQSEGRVAVKSLAQTRPYFRAVVVPLTDSVDLNQLQASGTVVAYGAPLGVVWRSHKSGVTAPVWRDICGSAERLRALMRDVQNLANKFKCPETANLQRAMQCRTTEGFGARAAGGAASLSVADGDAAARAAGGEPTPLASYDNDDFQPSKILARLIKPDVEPTYTDSESISSGSDTESDAQYAAAAAAGCEPPLAVSQLPGAAAAGGLAAGAVLSGGGGGVLGGVVIRNRPSLLDLERACRLSLAAIQVLPRTTDEERAAIWKHQAAALETQDVLERLTMAQHVMSEARGLLAAKCALLTLSKAA